MVLIEIAAPHSLSAYLDFLVSERTDSVWCTLIACNNIRIVRSMIVGIVEIAHLYLLTDNVVFDPGY